MSIKLTAKQKEGLTALGIDKPEDALFYFPYRYEVLQNKPYTSWQVNEVVTFEANVISKPKMTYFKGRHSVVYFDVLTNEDTLRISVFNRPWLVKLVLNQQITIVGKYEGGNKVLAMQVLNQPLSMVVGIHPVYSLKDKILDKSFNKIIDNLLIDQQNKINDFIPTTYKQEHQYLSRFEAIKTLHRPNSLAELKKALDTLKYEEFLRFNLLMAERRNVNFVQDENYAKTYDNQILADFINQLPFKLTEDQFTALKEILGDLRSAKQMSRLLQGDVGSGKTIVAFISMYACCLANKQAAMMAPTEILAKQHYQNLLQIFKNTNIKAAVLYSSLTTSEKKEIINKLKKHEIDIIVGTHSLFQESVEYHDLGLIVTDEQHRFGVKQRATLVAKGSYCDILMMSATPIPRTLATTLYGDIDVSTITQTPNARKLIYTKLIKQNSFIPVIKEIEKLLQEGNQMYVICPSIEISLTNRNVKDVYTNLSKYFMGKYVVGLLHGQMEQADKDEVQNQFNQGYIDILVATSVVEVGIDVKNANIMCIYDANRFGLSQLHQLRGRVGRGLKEGYCYLLTDTTDEEALNKLDIIVNNTNGFDISYYDLKLRGPGDIMGFKQSGLPNFTLGNVIDDNEIMLQAKKDADKIMMNINDYPLILEYVKENSNNHIINS